jgi:hypothetical protein
MRIDCIILKKVYNLYNNPVISLQVLKAIFPDALVIFLVVQIQNSYFAKQFNRALVLHSKK